MRKKIPFLPKAKTRSNSLKEKETILKTIHCHKIKFVQEGGYATYFLEIQTLLKKTNQKDPLKNIFKENIVGPHDITDIFPAVRTPLTMCLCLMLTSWPRKMNSMGLCMIFIGQVQ